MNQTDHILFVDDDPQSIQLCEKVVQKVNPGIQLHSFTSPIIAFEFLLNEMPAKGRAVLFMDLKMPVITGWEFLDCFETLDEMVKSRFRVFIHSNSPDPADRVNAKLHPLVEEFIEKPLTVKKLSAILMPKRFTRRELRPILFL